MRNVVSSKKQSDFEDTMSVCILAAGVSRTMSNYGNKSLLEIEQGKNLINYQIATVRAKFPHVQDIWCVLGADKARIVPTLDNKVRLIENTNYDKNGANKSISLLLDAVVCESLLLIHGDMLFNEHTLGEIGGQSCVIYDDKNRIQQEKVSVMVVDKKVENLTYGLDKKWGQIAYFMGAELNMLRLVAREQEENVLPTFEMINQVIERGGKFGASQPANMHITEINSYRNIRNFKENHNESVDDEG